jgi:hypothetical protein
MPSLRDLSFISNTPQHLRAGLNNYAPPGLGFIVLRASSNSLSEPYWGYSHSSPAGDWIVSILHIAAFLGASVLAIYRSVASLVLATITPRMVGAVIQKTEGLG